MEKFIRPAIISNLIIITLFSFSFANTTSKKIEGKK